MATIGETTVNVTFNYHQRKTADILKEAIQECSHYECASAVRMVNALVAHEQEIADVTDSWQKAEERVKQLETARIANLRMDAGAVQAKRDCERLIAERDAAVANSVNRLNERDAALRELANMRTERDNADYLRRLRDHSYLAEVEKLRAQIVVIEKDRDLIRKRSAERGELLDRLRDTLATVLNKEF